MARIVEWAQINGWLVYHTYNSLKSQLGFPDLVLVKWGRLVFIECKSDSGRVSLNQQQWITLLDSVANVTAIVARPSNWELVRDLLKA